MQSPGQLCDCIGEESSIDLKSDVNMEVHGGGRSYRRRRTVEEKEYPPPMPLMPWVLKKYYTGDGRLIIKEEKVERQDYFEAYRCDGRLVLNLVPLDDVVEEDCEERHAGEEINGEDEEVCDDLTAEKRVYRYDGIGVNPNCGGFGIAVTAFTPPVHT